MEVCGECARTAETVHSGLAGSSLFWHDLQPLKSGHWEPGRLLQKLEGKAEMTCLPEHMQDGCSLGSPQSLDL